MSPVESAKSIQADDKRIGYDMVEVVMANGDTKTLNKAEFERLPLRDRVDSIMKGHAKFFLHGAPIPATRALKG